MRKALLFVLLVSHLTWALDRQPNSDFRLRRQSLASKANGAAVLLFASNEAEGPNDLYGYRPDDNFFYLSGWSEPGAALLIVGVADSNDHPYMEILHILDGTAEAWIDGRDESKVRLEKGDTIALPANVPHSFRVVPGYGHRGF